MSYSGKQIITGLFLLSCLVGLSAEILPDNRSVPKTHTIQIEHMQFIPAVLTAKTGDKVIFMNKDMVVHNVTEASSKLWKSPDLASDKSWTMLVSKNVNYFCSFHPVMKGKILVK